LFHKRLIRIVGQLGNTADYAIGPIVHSDGSGSMAMGDRANACRFVLSNGKPVPKLPEVSTLI
jgi:hypothetical protein